MARQTCLNCKQKRHLVLCMYCGRALCRNHIGREANYAYRMRFYTCIDCRDRFDTDMLHGSLAARIASLLNLSHVKDSDILQYLSPDEIEIPSSTGFHRAVCALRANPELSTLELASALGISPQSAEYQRNNLLCHLEVFPDDEDGPAAGASVPSSPRPSRPSTDAQAQQQERGTTMGNILEFLKPKQSQQPHDTTPDGRPLTTSNMTQEQLRERRIARVEAAKVARPLHETFMLFLLKIWLVLGPPAFVVLTVFEVSYIFSAMLPPGDSADKIIFFGALFVDLAMMFTTFGVAIKRRDLAEKREVYGSVPKREELEVWFGTGLWLVFAVINVIGQSAFLLHIVQASSHPGDLTLIYLFIAARVTGFILGDACTAFFLAKVDSSPLKLIARSEREKGALYADIADAEGKRQIAEAEAEAAILLIQLDAEQKKRDAEFLAALKEKAFAAALGETPTTNTEPTRSRVYRGNT